ncbi:MAG: hypothetical protein Q4D19_11685 [Lautropia sp.]|nr:hypothetical protein [Lautropia sp.]
MGIGHLGRQLALLSSVAVLVAGCGALGGGMVSRGNAPTDVKGAASGSASVDANSELERCEEPLGTLAVDDGRLRSGLYTYSDTRSTQVNSLIRLAVQQSNCFVITSIGDVRTEGRISMITDKQRNSGEFRAGSRQEKGQRVAADYLMEPDVVIDNDSTGSVAGAVAGFLPPSVRGLAGGLEGKASVVTLTLFDIRSGVQIGISEGNSSSTNFGAAIGMLSGSGAAGLGGFSRSPEGKAIVAAFMDAYNNMVISMREYRAQEVKGGLGRGGKLKVAD